MLGNFQGHAGPGSCLILVGLFLLLRSLNISTHRPKELTQNAKKKSNNRALLLALPLFPSMRSQKTWLSIEGILFLAFSFMGGIIEFSSMIVEKSWEEENYEHLQVFGLLAICGLFFLFHFYGALNEMAWSLVYPVSLAFAGFLLSNRDQETEFRIFMRGVSAHLMYGVALCRAATLFVGYHSNRTYHQKIQRLEELNNTSLPGSSSEYTCFGSNHSNNTGYVIGVSSMYTNPFVFATPLPFLEAVLVLFTGVWWWVMAIFFYINEYPRAAEQNMGNMLVWSILFKVSAWMFAFLSVVCLALPPVINRWFPPDLQDQQANPKEVSTNDNRFEN